MSITTYPQVYDPDGKWVAFFYDQSSAENWVKKQKRAGYTITDRRPTKEERSRS